MLNYFSRNSRAQRERAKWVASVKEEIRVLHECLDLAREGERIAVPSYRMSRYDELRLETGLALR